MKVISQKNVHYIDVSKRKYRGYIETTIAKTTRERTVVYGMSKLKIETVEIVKDKEEIGFKERGEEKDEFSGRKEYVESKHGEEYYIRGNQLIEDKYKDSSNFNKYSEDYKIDLKKNNTVSKLDLKNKKFNNADFNLYELKYAVKDMVGWWAENSLIVELPEGFTDEHFTLRVIFHATDDNPYLMWYRPVNEDDKHAEVLGMNMGGHVFPGIDCVSAFELVYAVPNVEDVRIISSGALHAVREEDKNAVQIHKCSGHPRDIYFCVGTFAEHDVFGENSPRKFYTPVRDLDVSDVVFDLQNIVRYIENFCKTDALRNMSIVFTAIDVDYFCMNSYTPEYNRCNDFYFQKQSSDEINKEEKKYTDKCDNIFKRDITSCNYNLRYNNLFYKSSAQSIDKLDMLIGRDITLIPYSMLPRPRDIEIAYIFKRVICDLLTYHVFHFLDFNMIDYWVKQGFSGYLGDLCYRHLLGNNEFLYLYKEEKDYVVRNDVIAPPLFYTQRAPAEYYYRFFKTKSKLVFHSLEAYLSMAFLEKIADELIMRMTYAQTKKFESINISAYREYISTHLSTQNGNLKNINSQTTDLKNNNSIEKENCLSGDSVNNLNSLGNNSSNINSEKYANNHMDKIISTKSNDFDNNINYFHSNPVVYNGSNNDIGITATMMLLEIIKNQSGKDLTTFFDFYVFRPGLLRVELKFEINRKKSEVRVTMVQHPTSILDGANKRYTSPIILKTHEIEGVFDHEVCEGAENVFYYHTRAKKKKKDEDEEVMSLLFMRVDPKRMCLFEFVMQQPDYMFIEQANDKNLIGQIEAIDALALKPTVATCEALERIMDNTHVFYKVRIRIIYTLRGISFEGYNGVQRLIQYFIRTRCVPNSTIIRGNEFGLANYFVQKHLVRAICNSKQFHLAFDNFTNQQFSHNRLFGKQFDNKPSFNRQYFEKHSQDYGKLYENVHSSDNYQDNSYEDVTCIDKSKCTYYSTDKDKGNCYDNYYDKEYEKDKYSLFGNGDITDMTNSSSGDDSNETNHSVPGEVIIAFLEHILKFNDNSLSQFDDSGYLALVIQSLTFHVLDFIATNGPTRAAVGSSLYQVLSYTEGNVSSKSKNDSKIQNSCDKSIGPDGYADKFIDKSIDKSFEQTNYTDKQSDKISYKDYIDQSFEQTNYTDKISYKNSNGSTRSNDFTILEKCLNEIERFRIMDMVFQSNNNIITRATLSSLILLASFRLIVIDRKVLIALSQYPNLQSIRLTAIRGILLLYPKDALCVFNFIKYKDNEDNNSDYKGTSDDIKKKRRKYDLDTPFFLISLFNIFLKYLRTFRDCNNSNNIEECEFSLSDLRRIILEIRKNHTANILICELIDELVSHIDHKLPRIPRIYDPVAEEARRAALFTTRKRSKGIKVIMFDELRKEILFTTGIIRITSSRFKNSLANNTRTKIYDVGNSGNKIINTSIRSDSKRIESRRDEKYKNRTISNRLANIKSGKDARKSIYKDNKKLDSKDIRKEISIVGKKINVQVPINNKHMIVRVKMPIWAKLSLVGEILRRRISQHYAFQMINNFIDSYDTSDWKPQSLIDILTKYKDLRIEETPNLEYLGINIKTVKGIKDGMKETTNMNKDKGEIINDMIFDQKVGNVYTLRGMVEEIQQCLIFILTHTNIKSKLYSAAKIIFNLTEKIIFQHSRIQPFFCNMTDKLREKCTEFITSLRKNSIMEPFYFNVDCNTYKNYLLITRVPISFDEIISKMDKYTTYDAFIFDIERVYKNCISYNKSDSYIYLVALELKKIVDTFKKNNAKSYKVVLNNISIESDIINNKEESIIDNKNSNEIFNLNNDHILLNFGKTIDKLKDIISTNNSNNLFDSLLTEIDRIQSWGDLENAFMCLKNKYSKHLAIGKNCVDSIKRIKEDIYYAFLVHQNFVHTIVD